MSMSVCVSVSPRGYLRNRKRDIYQIFVHVAYVCGSVIPRHVDDRPHRLSAGRGWRECTATAKCNLRLSCFQVVIFIVAGRHDSLWFLHHTVVLEDPTSVAVARKTVSKRWQTAFCGRLTTLTEDFAIYTEHYLCGNLILLTRKIDDNRFTTWKNGKLLGLRRGMLSISASWLGHPFIEHRSWSNTASAPGTGRCRRRPDLRSDDEASQDSFHYAVQLSSPVKCSCSRRGESLSASVEAGHYRCRRFKFQ